MARDYSELKELMLQPLVHYKDVDFIFESIRTKWGPEICLRLQLSFVTTFQLPPKIIEYNIKCLHLTDCLPAALRDDSIKVITKLTSLQSLWITNETALAPSKINSILQNLTSLVGTCGNIANSMNNLSTFSQLTSLNVSRGKELNGKSVAWIPSVIPSIIHLQELNLSGFHLQMDSIEALAKLPYLSNLNISNTNPKQELVNAMASLNPLTSLNFSSNDSVDNLVPLLTHHSSLHTLLVSIKDVNFPTGNNVFVADTQLNHICTFLPELEYIDLEKWPISSHGMWQLTRLQSLRFVRLYRNRTDILQLQNFCAEMRQKGVFVETEDEEEVGV